MQFQAEFCPLTVKKVAFCRQAHHSFDSKKGDFSSGGPAAYDRESHGVRRLLCASFANSKKSGFSHAMDRFRQ